MATILENIQDDVNINGILERYFDIYLPANLDDQMDDKGDNPYLRIDGLIDSNDQTNINNIREVVNITEGYFKDILNPKTYDYFIADGPNSKKYIFQRAGSIIGTKVLSNTGVQSSDEHKYAFEGDNQFISYTDMARESGPTYSQAQKIDYDRQAKYDARVVTRKTFSPGGTASDSSHYVKISGDDIGKFFIEIPLLIMRNSTPMTPEDLDKLKSYSQKVNGGKLELEVSVSPYTVLYVEEVSGSESEIPRPTSPTDHDAVRLYGGGRFKSKKDFIIRAADGLVSDILSGKRDNEITNSDLLNAVKEIFSSGQDVRLMGSSNAYEAQAFIDNIFEESGTIRIRVKSSAPVTSNPFKIYPLSGTDSEVLAIATPSARVGITSPAATGKAGRKKARGAKGTAANAVNIYSATENRSDALNPFERQFLGPKYIDVVNRITTEKEQQAAARRAAAERNRKRYSFVSSQYTQPPIDYQDILIDGFNSLTDSFAGDNETVINRKFNEIAIPKLREDRDKFFELISTKISPKESIESSLKDLYMADSTSIRFLKALDIAVIKINILYSPYMTYLPDGRRIQRESNSSLNVFDLSGVKIGFRIAK